MRRWPDLAARVALGSLVLGAIVIAAASFGLARGVLGAGWALLLLGTALLFASRFSRRYWRRIGPALDPDRDAQLHVRRDGAFEWMPVGQPVPYTSYATRPPHRWWDAERGAMYQASVAFDVPDEVDPRALRAATAKALRAASAALPARGKVRASAALRDEEGPTSLVRVRLRVQGVGAEAAWSRAAAEAFARAFLAALDARWHVAAQR